MAEILRKIDKSASYEVITSWKEIPITMREFVRVQTSDKEPIFVRFCDEKECTLRSKVLDISEMGIGILLSGKDLEKFFNIIGYSNSGSETLIHKKIRFYMEMPDGHELEVEGELRNVVTEREGVYVRLGFRIKLKDMDLKHVRAYIMKRQKEIIEQFKLL